MDSESRAIRLPIPGIGKMIAAGLFGVLAWAIWSTDLDSSTNPHTKRREKLWSPDATAIERIQAVEEWALQGEYALPELTRALKSPHENVRSTAVLALSRIGPLAQRSVPQLYGMLRDPDETVRANVVHALLQIDDHLDEAVPLLVDLLSDPDENVRTSAQEALTRIGRPAVLPVCAYLTANPGPGRKHGLSVLMNLQMEHERIAAVAHTLLPDDDVEVQSRALIILTFLDAFAVDEIIPYIHSDSADVQLLVLRALQQRPEEARHVVPEIVALLNDAAADGGDDSSDPRLVGHIFETLKLLGPAAVDAVPQIVSYLEHREPRLRATAVDALAHIARDDESVRRIQTMVLGDAAPMVVSAAAEALQTCRPERVAELLPPLQSRLAGGRPDQVMLAASAAHGLGPAAAELTPALVRCLDDAAMPRAVVVFALGRIGTAARPAIPQLLKLIHLEELQTSIFWALTRIPPPPRYIPEIERHVLKVLDETHGVHHLAIAPMRSAMVEERVRKRIYAFQLLGEIADGRDAVGDMLLGYVEEPDSSVRWTVLRALTHLEGREDRTVPLLIASLNDSSRYVQATVLLGLGELKSRPELCVPVLIDYLHDSDPYLTSAAALSLASFPGYGDSAVERLQALIENESNQIQNSGRHWMTAWESRRFPQHLERLHSISVKEAAQVALDAIDGEVVSTGYVLPIGTLRSNTSE